LPDWPQPGWRFRLAPVLTELASQGCAASGRFYVPVLARVRWDRGGEVEPPTALII